MGGSYEGKVMNVLRSIPHLEMTKDKRESIVRELERIKLSEPVTVMETNHRLRKPYRWVRSAAAMGAAVIIVSGAAYQITDHRGKAAPVPNQVKPELTSAVAYKWKKMLGFLPLKPTYLPPGVIQQKAALGMGTDFTGKKSRSYSISYRYQNGSQNQTIGSGKNQTQSTALYLLEEPLADPPSILRDFSLHYVTVNDVQFMEPVNRQSAGRQPKGPIYPWLFWKHNGLLFVVTGTQSKSDLAKVLLSLKPVTSPPPDEVDESATGAHADTTTFKVILPTFLPSGLKQKLDLNTESGEYIGPGNYISSAYNTEYLGPGGNIGIEEYYTRDTKNPVVMEKNSTPMQIQGQTVYLVQYHTYVNDQTMAPYYRFEWIDPKTNVHYWVDGQSTTTQEIMTKGLMEKVVGSMIAQTAK